MTGPPVILPPFTEETARPKVQAAEDAWNTRDPERVALAYTEDSQWRNRDEFLTGRDAILEFLRAQVGARARLPAAQGAVGFTGNRIAVRFEYEWRDADGQWWRSHGNEHWEFDEQRLMRRREASINDYRDRRTNGASPPASGATRATCDENLHRTSIRAGWRRRLGRSRHESSRPLLSRAVLGPVSAARAATPRLPCSTANETLCGDGGPAVTARLLRPPGSRRSALASRRGHRQPRGAEGAPERGHRHPAGSAPPGYCGDGGPAVAAQLNAPADVSAAPGGAS